MGPIIISKSSVEEQERRGARWTLIGCSCLVFLSSVCIMVLELTASRLIARAVGSSLYTWTSVIGVILAGISVGNFLGGWLADRYTHKKLLAWCFFLSSLCCVLIYPMSQLIGTTRPNWLSWPIWIVTVVSFLFLNPAIALGTISPIAASMALAKARSTGSTVGNVYAWGALGSILGTFLAGFFLISSVGTQNIIWMIAATLALLGTFVATGQVMFRGVMLFGWLQFILWVGFFASAKQPELEAGEVENWWHKILGHAHNIGIEAGLRGDDPDEYHVESDYFSVNVAMRKPEQDSTYTVPVLILDNLVHSYFDPNNPTKLEYEYEKIYAAVTERAAERWQRKVSSPLNKLPFEAGKLPAGISYDADGKALVSTGAMTETQFSQLLELSEQAPYWQVIQNLTSPENMKFFSGVAALPLEKLPDGVVFPKHLEDKIKFDATLGAITRYAVLSSSEREILMGLGPDRDYYKAVSDLHSRSRQTSTLFIGGGGFVFPRWIEILFPHNPLIHVLELDPAVKLAVQKKMGLPPDDETNVKTILGDARNSVDDLLNGLDRQPQFSGPHNLYDFVYGDAFNDFSVPWHLTTREFTEKIHRLLRPDEGMFLINVIDIYPRAQYPRKLTAQERQNDKPEIGMEFVPEAFLPDDLAPETWTYAKAPFQDFEIRQLGPDSATKSGKLPYTVGYRRQMTTEVRDQLLALAPDHKVWKKAVQELYTQSYEFRAGRFIGAYVNTVCQVFPYVYVFTSDGAMPSDDRDTFVIVCSLKHVDFDNLAASGSHWQHPPFAWMKTDATGQKHYSSQMNILFEHGRGITLTDDYAPVDNLLVPVFSRETD